MTDGTTRKAVIETVDALRHLSGNLSSVVDQNIIAFPLTPQAVASWSDQQRLLLHGFLRMFEQLIDLTGRRAMRGILLLAGEDLTRKSARDVWDVSEKLGIIDSSDEWRAMVELRNALIHDYPLSQAEQAELANRAHERWPTLHRYVASVISAAEARL